MQYHDVGSIRWKDRQTYNEALCLCPKCLHEGESNIWHPDKCNYLECECCTQDIPTEAEEE